MHIAFITNLKSCCFPPTHTPKKKRALQFSKAWVQVPWVVSSISFTSASPWPAASWARPGPLAFLRLLDLMSFLLPVSWPVAFPILSGRLSLSYKDRAQMSSSLSSLLTPTVYPGGTISCFLLWGFTTLPQSTSAPYMALNSYSQSCLLSTHVNVCLCVCVCMCLYAWHIVGINVY